MYAIVLNENHARSPAASHSVNSQDIVKSSRDLLSLPIGGGRGTVDHRTLNLYDESAGYLFVSSYDNILRSVESLSRVEQLRLISELAEYLRVHTTPEKRTSILELQGLGKEIWQGLDAQEYVNHERTSWDG
jgi:hypothetical protein